MASATTTPTRRGFLAVTAAAAAATSVALPTTAYAIVDRAAWNAAMTDAERADAAYDRLDRLHDGLTRQTYLNEANRLSGEVTRANRALMHMPAPDRSALRWKLDQILVYEGDGYTSAWSEDYVRQTIADVARLLGDA